MNTVLSSLTTQKGVIAAIESIGLNCPVPVLALISQNCKDPFLCRLRLCLDNNDERGENKRYLASLFNCLAPDSVSFLQTIDSALTIRHVAIAAQKAPVRLMTAIVASKNDSHPKRGDALAFLKDLRQIVDSMDTCAPAKLDPPSSQYRPIAPTPAAPPEPTPTGNEGPTTNETTKRHQSHHVYGSSYALCFNATVWNGSPGIMVDAAEQNGGRYDWKDAVHVWLSALEIAACTAVFRRWRQDIRFDAHGSQNNKSFSLEFQKTHYFAKVAAKVESGKVRAVRISSEDATVVSMLFSRQLAAAYQGIPISEILATIQATHQLDHHG